MSLKTNFSSYGPHLKKLQFWIAQKVPMPYNTHSRESYHHMHQWKKKLSDKISWAHIQNSKNHTYLYIQQCQEEFKTRQISLQGSKDENYTGRK